MHDHDQLAASVGKCLATPCWQRHQTWDAFLGLGEEQHEPLPKFSSQRAHSAIRTYGHSALSGST